MPENEPVRDAQGGGGIRTTSSDQVARLFDTARRVVIVPGYGLALSGAQHAVRELTHLLEARGIQVEFAVHPVAGRMPGHMNVTLASAEIANEKVKALEDINPTFQDTDVAVVIGANDIVNPLARANPDTPLTGMDVLDVDKARRVVIVKRTAGPGYAGIENPLFAAENALMLLGDGEKAVLDLIGSLRAKPKAAERRAGVVTSWQRLSSLLALFRLSPQKGVSFPGYKPGQYIALRREDCRLTRRVVDHDGRRHYIPDLDEDGVQRRGPITHSYSICSAPFETERHGELEFFLVLEEAEWGFQGRLTESMFRMQPGEDESLGYVDRITGDFTLDKRARDAKSVVMVGTGTGLAPFVSMIKEMHHDAGHGRRDQVRYTLFHTSRAPGELAYLAELQAIEKEGRFDFVYVPTVSRPGDQRSPAIGTGRANNVLRHVLGMPLKEDEDLRAAEASGKDVPAARVAREKAVRPTLPAHLELARLRARMAPGETVAMSCGNPAGMEDVKHATEANGIRFEKEDWKHVPAHD